jgi:hypothetical protein
MGKVLAEDTAVPVPFALVEIQGPDGSSRIWKTLSNSRGEFSFPEVPQGTYRFKATAWAFWSVEGDVRVSSEADAGGVDLRLLRAWYSEQEFEGRCRWLAMLPGERIAVEHDAVRVSAVEGRVVGFDVSGEPISGALIEVRGPDESDRVLSALTNSLGRFRLAGIPEGRYVWKVTLFGFESILGDLVVDPEVTSETPWEIVLKPAG